MRQHQVWWRMSGPQGSKVSYLSLLEHPEPEAQPSERPVPEPASPTWSLLLQLHWPARPDAGLDHVLLPPQTLALLPSVVSLHDHGLTGCRDRNSMQLRNMHC